jgi:hypothetical protein
MIKIFTRLILLLLLFPIASVRAQQLRATYPVQVTAVMIPPYSLYLSDYGNTDNGRENIIVTLLNRDLEEGFIDVRLHVSIQAGSNLRLDTRDNNVLPVIRIQSGMPVKIGQDELAPYFRLENLSATGAFSGRFPEGLLEICFTAYEATTGRALSQTSCCRAWITLNRPPLLSLPQNQMKFPFREPQNFFFQWTPRHQALSNVEYEFTLKEIHDTGTAVENAFSYSPAIYTETVSGTSLAYTVMQPPLLENTVYAWQVRAVVKDGFQELNIFENNGYSEINTFSIAPACYPPTNVSAVQESSYARVEWSPSDRNLQQVVAYRAKDYGTDWHLQKANTDYANLFDLSAGKEIEIKVGTVCTDGSIVYSEPITFILEDWRKSVIENCGKTTTRDLSENALLKDFPVGDVFYANDFPIMVTRISGSGTFSGYGWTRIPAFMDVKVAVKFENIRINESRQLVGKGYVETTYDQNASQIADLDFIDQGGVNTGQTKTGDIWTDLTLNVAVPDGGTMTYNPQTGTVTVTDADGNPVGEPVKVPDDVREKFNSGGQDATFTVQDKDGNIYTFGKDENGNATAEQTGKTGSGSSSTQFNQQSVDTKTAVVRFSRGQGKYAFDEWNDAYEKAYLIRDKYENLNGYPVACKLIPPGRTDKVAFEVQQTGKEKIDVSKIIFRSGTGTEYVAKDGEISITGGRENDAQDVFALYPDSEGKLMTIGKLKVLSYKELNLNLTLVPVNGNTLDKAKVETYLNSIYEPIGIHWNVALDADFSYSASTLDSKSSGIFSRETNEMKALNAAYKADRTVEASTVYLFILKSGNIDEKSLAGDMPRRKQFGYIFTDDCSETGILRTIAHELGHGRFDLLHTFAGDYGSLDLPDNLMSYGTGAHIAKWQWDVIFDPALIINPFEGDEAGMRKDEAERAQITRFMYALSDAMKNQSKITQSSFLKTDDVKILTEKKYKTVKADHIFYDTSLTKYFEEVELRLVFNSDTEHTKDIDANYTRSYYIGGLEARLIFIFKKKEEIPVFVEFIKEPPAITPPESTIRKAFFIHGTASDSERWMEHPLTKAVLLCIANTDKEDDNFSWTKYNHLTNSVIDRNKAAQDLVNYVLSKSIGFEEIVLIGHSHGGNVALQAVNQLVDKGKKVYIIDVATPAYNEPTVTLSSREALQNSDFISESHNTNVSPTGAPLINTTFVFKNPENPTNTKLTRHIHLWNKEDKTAGDLALGSDDVFKNPITENIEISTYDEYYYPIHEAYRSLIENFINAHGFDSNRPQLIYTLMLNGKIPITK